MQSPKRCSEPNRGENQKVMKLLACGKQRLVLSNKRQVQLLGLRHKVQVKPTALDQHLSQDICEAI